MEMLNDEHIKTFLETAPLYSWVEYEKPVFNRSSLWIKQVDAYCKTCKQDRPFQDLRPRGSGSGLSINALSSGTSLLEFKCVSCGNEKLEYWVEQVVLENTIKLQKCGERPRKTLDRDSLLQKFFSNDSEYYEKAIICLSHNYGIAAFAYVVVK